MKIEVERIGVVVTGRMVGVELMIEKKVEAGMFAEVGTLVEVEAFVEVGVLVEAEAFAECD